VNIDHFSYLIDREHRLLLIGIVLMVLAAVFALAGEAFEPRHGFVCRTEEPKRFWWNVVLFFLSGLFFIGFYIAQNSN
jgi:sterol desaturase/sphingolipid hydroxylase (fatty acid hydroxylase superfamily)